MLCYAMLCYVILRYATLRYATLATLRYAMLCYAMLCYAVLCYAGARSAADYRWGGRRRRARRHPTLADAVLPLLLLLACTRVEAAACVDRCS
jgi:hypothetical protein